MYYIQILNTLQNTIYEVRSESKLSMLPVSDVDCHGRDLLLTCTDDLCCKMCTSAEQVDEFLVYYYVDVVFYVVHSHL